AIFQVFFFDKFMKYFEELTFITYALLYSAIGVNVGIATAVTTVAIIIISEVIPKSVAATYPDRMSRLVYTPIAFFVTIFKPITKLLNWLTDMINNLLSKGQEDQQRLSKEE